MKTELGNMKRKNHVMILRAIFAMSSVPGGTAPPSPGSTAGWGGRNGPAGHAVLSRGWGPPRTEHRVRACETRCYPRPCSDEADSTAGPSERCSDAGITPSTYPGATGPHGSGTTTRGFYGPGHSCAGAAREHRHSPAW